MAPTSDFRTLILLLIAGSLSADDRLRLNAMLEEEGVTGENGMTREEEFRVILSEQFENQKLQLQKNWNQRNLQDLFAEEAADNSLWEQ